MEGKTMKIGAFAAKYGVTDRHARRLVAECESDLVGHIEKRGNVGTWIDEYAEAYLRDKLRNPMEILPAEPETLDPAELQDQINVLMAKCMGYAEKLADAERRAAEGIAAQAVLEHIKANVLLLEGKVEDRETEAKLAAERADKAERECHELKEQHRAELQKAADKLTQVEQDNQDLKGDLDIAARRLVAAKERDEQIRAKIEELEHAGIFQRRRILRELKELQNNKGE